MEYPATHLSLSREELYELVWSKPMRHLAKDYGISDRAIAKLCARKQVPVPPRGYWAQKSSGQKVVRPPLPAFVEKEKPKPEPKEPEVQKPAKKNSQFSSPRDEREKTIKEKIKDHRRRLAGGVHYTVLVDSWRCDYSFGINSSFNPLRRCKDKWDSMIFGNPFDEVRSLVFIGKFLEPSKLKDKKVEVYLKQRSHLNEEERDRHLNYYSENPPHSVGSLSKQNSDRWCFLYFPGDAINLLLAAALGNKIKVITFRGEKTRYGRASIFEFSLREKVEEEDE